MDVLVHGILVHVSPIELPVFVPDIDTTRTGYYSIKAISAWTIRKTGLLVPVISRLWIVRLVRFTCRCFGWIVFGGFVPYLSIFLWIKYLAIVIRAPAPDYLFSEFMVLGFITYESPRIAKDDDSWTDSEDDLDLDFIHIPVDGWAGYMELEWTQVRLFFELDHADLAYYVGKQIFNWVHDASIAWIYRNTHPPPNDKEVQASAGARSQFVIRPGHSIYRPPRLQTIFTAEHRLEHALSQEQVPEETELDTAQEQATEAEQEESTRMKRRTRRGGRKLHERKQRRLERMTAYGDSEYGGDDTAVSVPSEPR
ncbi:unnamed protein product [Rhizoctonia solani]|uniref:Uncharacterized protein n=1 Tax=Rhizoctonia solani TaxID=456999 RepID=A0A8H3D7X3_9AGAM|nr:unnamed protein product [Rhizoctonia solani]